jgi:hypothetical protein
MIGFIDYFIIYSYVYSIFVEFILSSTDFHQLFMVSDRSVVGSSLSRHPSTRTTQNYWVKAGKRDYLRP